MRLELWDAGANVRLEVHNQGTPIAPDMRPHLFDPFRRGTESRHNKADGLGLGLFISNQIVIAHGGTLSVRSPDEAGGTTFGFELPKRQPGSGQA